MHDDLDLLTAFNENLISLPAGFEYVSLELFQLKRFARGILRMACLDRQTAIDLPDFFTPAPLSYGTTSLPYFRPLIPFDNEAGYDQVYPVFFNSYYFRDSEEHKYQSAFTWYHSPLPMVPDIRIIISLHICQDVARVFEKTDYGLPVGNKIIDKKVTDGMRTANIYWDSSTPVAVWKALMLMPNLDEDEVTDHWADTIELSGTPDA